MSDDHDAIATTTPVEAPAWPDPAERRRPGAGPGTPTTLADGREWALAAAMPALGGIWDVLFDARMVGGQYDPADVRAAAFRLLEAHYDLTPDEAYGLIVGVPPASLVPAVETALLGPERPERSYSEWITLAVCLAGLDPDRVAPGRRLDIALAMEAAGRCPARGEFIASARVARRRAEVMQLAAATAARPTPTS
jgi:hypothetical protein